MRRVRLAVGLVCRPHSGFCILDSSPRLWLSMVNLETGKRNVFLKVPARTSITSRWSPDSRWIVFQVESDAESVTAVRRSLYRRPGAE